MTDPTPAHLATRAPRPLTAVADDAAALRILIETGERQQKQRRQHLAELESLINRRQRAIDNMRARLAQLENPNQGGTK